MPKRGPNDLTLSVSLRQEWESMSAEERVETTKDRFEQLKENRVVKNLGRHTEEESAFHDAQATLTRVEDEVNIVSL